MNFSIAGLGWWLRIGLVLLGGLAALWIAGSASIRHVSAQQSPLCGPSYGTEDQRRDPALDVALDATATVSTVAGVAAWGRDGVDEVTVSWSVDLRPAGLKCIWVGLGTPEEPVNSVAELILEPDQKSFTVRPTASSDAVPARVCYRLIPMSDVGAGRATGVCAILQNPRGPEPLRDPPFSPGAPSAGTGLISDEGSGAWVVGFLVVTGTIVLVLVVSGRLRRHAG
jgi:hypothetical protein